jgi:hypothetical protein
LSISTSMRLKVPRFTGYVRRGLGEALRSFAMHLRRELADVPDGAQVRIRLDELLRQR